MPTGCTLAMAAMLPQRRGALRHWVSNGDLDVAASRQQPWHRQLYSLGIHRVGEVNTKALARAFPSAAALAAASAEDPEAITAVFGIGAEIAQSLQQWFAKPANQTLLEELRGEGLSLAASEAATGGLLRQEHPGQTTAAYV